MFTKVHIRRALVQYCKSNRMENRHCEYGMIGILATDDAIIDSVYFIKHRDGGCKWCPKLYRQDIAKRVCDVLKDKKRVKGLILITGKDINSSMNDWFYRMINNTVWMSPAFIYLIYGSRGLWGYQWDYESKYVRLAHKKLYKVK